MTADRIAFTLAVLAACATVAFAATRTVCPYCRARYANCRALQRHIRLAHHD